MKITITCEMIEKAGTYIPILEKESIAAEAAENCLDSVQINVKNGETIIPMPPMYRENLSLKARYLAGILAVKYLNYPIEPVEADKTKTLMDAYMYDSWAASHVYDQLERLKRGGNVPVEIKNKIYEIMSDFRDMEKRINADIYSLLQVQNDICTRLMVMVESMTTPEALKNSGEELKKLKGELDTYAAKKKAGADNG